MAQEVDYVGLVVIFLLMQVAKSSTSDRISFELDIRFLPGARLVAQVDLAFRDRGTYVGKAEGPSSRAGLFECAARATIRALESATHPTVLESAADKRVGFELRDVIELGELGSVLILLSVSEAGGDRAWKLCGACSVDDGPERAAVKAVLKAANRLFEDDYIFLPQSTSSAP